MAHTQTPSNQRDADESSSEADLPGVYRETLPWSKGDTITWRGP